MSREIPILFSAAMVLANLAGSKTQTRRVVKWRGLAPGLNLQFSGLSVERSGSNFVLTSPTRCSHEYRSVPQPCPYGLPGDSIWQRETFFAFGRWETRFSAKKGRDEWHFFDMTIASGHAYQFVMPAEYVKAAHKRGGVTPTWWKRPAIFMPRVASRASFLVKSVRVQRLQDISEADAIAEGLGRVRGPLGSTMWEYSAVEGGQFADPRVAYHMLWDSINGDTHPWTSNPLVWRIEYERIKP